MKILDDNHWWNERLEAWSHEGFNIDTFRDSLRAEPERASELLLEFDGLVAQNRSLRRRVIDSSMPREKKGRWLNELDNVVRTEELIEKWTQDASVNRPWEPYVHKAEERWSERGRRSNLSAIVRRLNALDPSSFSACQPLLILFDDVSSENLIASMLDEIESDEARRREVVNEMINLLDSDGIDASSARKMKINDALDHLSNLQARADLARKTRLRIEKDIRPFDSDLADILLAKRGDDISQEVDAIIDNFSSRMAALTSTIEEWKIGGIIFPDGGEILPQDLLDWEAELPEIEKVVEIHLRALERWKEFETFWPDRCENSTLAGHLNHTEEFIDLVDSLDQEWREMELHGMQIISSWEDRGFAMDVWRSRVAEEPRSAIAWIKREEAKYQEAADLIEALMSLDSSIGSEDEILRRVAILREFDLDSDLLDEMNHYVDSRARRGARHRSMLESEWMDLVRRGLAEDVPTSSLTLSEFEQLISDSRLKRNTSGVPVERLKKRMKQEIDGWYENGFVVDEMSKMLDENPMALALRMTSIREAVGRHEQLRRRISAIDWTRNPELSVAINLDLARPDKLDSLAASIPQLMMDLAQMKVADADFKFIPWRPQKRTRPVLVPAPQNTVEDAMEAILEEMDSNDIEIEIEVDEIVQPEAEIEESAEPNLPDKIAVIVEEESTEKEEEIVIAEMPEEESEILADSDEEKILDESEKVTVVPEDAEIESDTSAIQSLLHSIGLSETADMYADNGDLNSVRRALASHVGLEPRDMRLDRLLRLSLRLMPKGDDDDIQRLSLISNLADMADGLSKWTRTRLEARHSGSIGKLVEDAATLGQALERIPGPGTPIPLDADEYPLPALEDIVGLANEVKVLKRRVMLANSGGVR